jgi:hypothetical protein
MECAGVAAATGTTVTVASDCEIPLPVPHGTRLTVE